MAMLVFASPVFADETDLVVDFEVTPLFDEANFLPGTTVSRTAEVTNNTLDSKDIITEAINVSDPDDFGDVLKMSVKEGAAVLFDGTLADFFDGGEIALSSLAAGDHTTYVFSVSFESDADNSYQEKSLGFDILIGFKGDEGGGGDDGGGGGGGEGDGGGGIFSGLVIQNESSVDVTGATATIVWGTSFKSTSRVVYGTVPGVFDFSDPPNYNYPFSTIEFDTPANPSGVTLHSVTLMGLTPGVTYYFRTISHASPDTISKEGSFTTLGGPPPGGSGFPPPGSNVSAHSENAPSSGTLLTTETPPDISNAGQAENGIINPTAEELPSREVSQNTGDDNTNLLTAALFGLGSINIWWWPLLILLLLLIAYWIYRRYK